MIQKDYIERLTQQIAQVIAKLIGKEITESIEILDEAHQEWLKVDRSLIDGIELENLIPFLTAEKNLNIHQIEFLAELLAQEGEIYFKNKEYLKSKNKLRKSLILFDYVDQEQKLYSLERLSKISHIKNCIEKIDHNINDI